MSKCVLSIYTAHNDTLSSLFIPPQSKIMHLPHSHTLPNFSLSLEICALELTSAPHTVTKSSKTES